jgi:hypothetical protein
MVPNKSFKIVAEKEAHLIIEMCKTIILPFVLYEHET